MREPAIPIVLERSLTNADKRRQLQILLEWNSVWNRSSQNDRLFDRITVFSSSRRTERLESDRREKFRLTLRVMYILDID